MRYLMADYRSAEREFFHRTGAYTLNHLFALREEVVKDKPDVVEKLFTALKEANALADRYRDDKQRREAAWEREGHG